MKILHSADWHLDSPLLGRTEAQAALLRSALLQIPHKIAALALAQGCDLMLLSGDLFDGAYSVESVSALRSALEEVKIPVFIAPGNHDYVSAQSPWTSQPWPENVHIFTSPAIESVPLEALSCRIYGAAFTSPDAPALLENFHADCTERYAVAVLHGDPTQTTSPYCPITTEQVNASGLDYLALGHIHKGGQLTAGKTLCAWPGCPQGRGYDECEAQGALIVTLDGSCNAHFVPLDTIQFHDWECDCENDAAAALGRMLPAAASQDFYRITLTGESESVDIDGLAALFPHLPNLTLRDRSVLPIDLGASAGEDTLEGIYFRMLQDALAGQDEATCAQIRLAAKLSKQLLQGQEVKLP